jgi:hypothetical protein
MRSERGDWSSCTWEGAEEATLRDSMEWTFAQKLRWLEQMQALVQAMSKPNVTRESTASYQAKSE